MVEAIQFRPKFTWTPIAVMIPIRVKSTANRNAYSITACPSSLPNTEIPLLRL